MEFEQLGPYRIVRELGKGGMGRVYEGVELATGRRAAIKILRPQLATADDFRERFGAEIESLKKLRHEAIVRLYGYGEQQGNLYYAMELVEGSTLEDQLRAGRRFDWREVTRIGIRIAKALKHAHDHGVIHRDLKPANLLLDEQGLVKLSDFGIARLFGSTSLTSVGGVLGTAEYMSPEQASGQGVDERCDQYSLGGVLFALLAGRPPFRASGLPELLQLQRFAQPEPISSYAADVPPELERIIMQLLEKDPAKRFRNTHILARQLEAMQQALSRGVSGPWRATRGGEVPRGAVDPVSLEQTQPAPELASEPSQPDLIEQPAGRLPQQQQGVPADRVPQREPESSPVDRQGQFTTVEEEDPRFEPRVRRTSLQSALQGLALLGGLFLLGVAVWHFSRARSADELYAEIHAATSGDGTDRLARVERPLREFLERFGSDPRAAKLAGYQRELDLDRLERRLAAAARRADAPWELSPIEWMYVHALKLANDRPEQAMHQFEALVQLYDEPPQDHPDQHHVVPESEAVLADCLQLAKRRLTEINEPFARYAAEHRRLLDERTSHAEQIQPVDPSQAQKIWQSIVTLYGDKPWAAPWVERAKRALAQSDKGLAVEPSTGSRPVANDE